MTAGAPLPTPEQELLLQAALGSGASVGEAWAAWSSRVALDDADHSSARLLPLVYLNLERHGVDGPDLGRLKGIYRHAWAANQTRFQAAGEAMDVLAAAGIPTAPIKGLALVQRAYPNAGARPMDDVDILVPTSERDAAWTALREAGWLPAREIDEIPDSRLRLLGGVNLRRDESPLQVDLQWEGIPFAGRDADLWRRVEPAEVLGRPTHLLDPAHELLVALCHGAKRESLPPVRWIPDAVLLMREHQIDWDELCRLARASRYVLVAARGLRYLRETFAAPVPPAALQELEAAPVAPFERRILRARLRQPGSLHGLAFHRDHYRQVSGRWPFWRRAAGFAPYLRDWWGLGSVLDVPAEAVRRFRLDAARSPGAREPVVDQLARDGERGRDRR
jgi:hypothetical protein